MPLTVAPEDRAQPQRGLARVEFREMHGPTLLSRAHHNEISQAVCSHVLDMRISRACQRNVWCDTGFGLNRDVLKPTKHAVLASPSEWVVENDPPTQRL